MTNNQTEAERFLNDSVSDKAEEVEQAEETVEKDEVIETEEELEIEQAISEYETKIEALDAKLSEYKANSINDSKREAMRKMNYSDEQIERYLSHIDGETADEIKASVIKLAGEIPPGNDNFADPSPFNGRAARPKTVDHTEIGRQAFERVKHKVFPFFRK